MLRYNNVEVVIQGYFSFANSPYYAHKRLSAVDIYSPSGEEVVSPFTGELVFYRIVHREHVSGYIVGDYYIRLLHVKPYQELGDKIVIGAPLGSLVESPFFYPWTDLHMHLEVREKPEFIRASGGLRLEPSSQLLEEMEKSLRKAEPLREAKISGKIVLVRHGRYMLVEPDNKVSGPITPLVVEVNGVKGFIDGGIPHYRHGILVSPFKKINGDVIGFSNILLGIVDEYYGWGFHHFIVDRRRLKVYLNDVKVKGIGLYIGAPFIKIIPVNWSNTDYQEGDRVEISFRNVGV